MPQERPASSLSMTRHQVETVAAGLHDESVGDACIGGLGAEDGDGAKSVLGGGERVGDSLADDEQRARLRRRVALHARRGLVPSLLAGFSYFGPAPGSR